MTKSGRTEEVRIPKILGSEKIARERAAMFAAAIGFDADRIEDIKTAVGEATLNALEHARTDDPSDAVMLTMDNSGEVLEVSIASKGQAFLSAGEKPDIKAKIEGMDRPRGWGLFLIRQLSDQVEFESDNIRTTVRMKFFRKSTQRH